MDKQAPTKLNTYEKQARLSVRLAGVGGAATLAVLILLGRNYHESWVNYSPHGKWFLAFGGALFVGLVTGLIGFFVGLNSAGQRRNTLSRLSWTGFFLSALVITLIVSAAIFFFFTRNSVDMTPTGR